jgi:hypothetical protein
VNSEGPAPPAGLSSFLRLINEVPGTPQGEGGRADEPPGQVAPRLVPPNQPPARTCSLDGTTYVTPVASATPRTLWTSCATLREHPRLSGTASEPRRQKRPGHPNVQARWHPSQVPPNQPPARTPPCGKPAYVTVVAACKLRPPNGETSVTERPRSPDRPPQTNRITDRPPITDRPAAQNGRIRERPHHRTAGASASSWRRAASRSPSGCNSTWSAPASRCSRTRAATASASPQATMSSTSRSLPPPASSSSP